MAERSLVRREGHAQREALELEVQRHGKKDIVEAGRGEMRGWRRKIHEGWRRRNVRLLEEEKCKKAGLSRKDAFPQQKWIVGITQIAIRLR